MIAQHLKYDALLVFSRYGFLEPGEMKNNGWTVIKTDALYTVKTKIKIRETKKNPKLVHVGVIDPHAAKDWESFDKILVILGEGQIVEFVD